MNDEPSAALVLHPDGGIVEVNLNPGRDHLAVMREHLNCRLVDVVRLSTTLDMWIDDEGAYTQPVNPLATLLARHYGYIWQPYWGPVMLAGVNDGGDSIDLDVHQVRALLTRLMGIAGD